MTAEDFFDWAKLCGEERRAAEIRRRHLYDRKSSSPMFADGPSSSDPMASVDAAMDRETEILAEIERCDRVIRHANSVIQAVGQVLGGNVSVMLQLYYIDLENTWEDIAFELHMSLRSVYSARRRAMEWVNVSGLVAAVGRDV